MLDNSPKWEGTVYARLIMPSSGSNRIFQQYLYASNALGTRPDSCHGINLFSYHEPVVAWACNYLFKWVALNRQIENTQACTSGVFSLYNWLIHFVRPWRMPEWSTAIVQHANKLDGRAETYTRMKVRDACLLSCFSGHPLKPGLKQKTLENSLIPGYFYFCFSPVRTAKTKEGRAF